MAPVLRVFFLVLTAFSLAGCSRSTQDEGIVSTPKSVLNETTVRKEVLKFIEGRELQHRNEGAKNHSMTLEKIGPIFVEGNSAWVPCRVTEHWNGQNIPHQWEVTFMRSQDGTWVLADVGDPKPAHSAVNF